VCLGLKPEREGRRIYNPTVNVGDHDRGDRRSACDEWRIWERYNVRRAVSRTVTNVSWLNFRPGQAPGGIANS